MSSQHIILNLSRVLEWVGGYQEFPDFRRRLFNVLQFLSSIISLLSLLFNALMGFTDQMVGFSIACVAATVVLWGIGRFSTLPLRTLGFCTVLLVLPTFGGAWFLFGGADGMTPPLLFWMICLMFIFEHRLVQLLVLVGILVFAAMLFVTEARFPALVNPYYLTDAARRTDVAITYILSLAGYCVLAFSMAKIHSDTAKQLRYEQEQRAELKKDNIEERAREREERLELLQRMSRGLAHDLNNLLMVISSSAELIDESIQDQDTAIGDTRADLKVVMDTASAAARLTRRLLDSSLTEELVPEVLSVRDFLTNLAPVLSQIAQDVSIHLVLDSHAAPVKIHQSELEQVVMNLALNGIQAMNHRGELYIRCRVHDGFIQLEVEDSGAGIDAENLEQIFEPLFTTKLDAGGTGIGLSTVRSIVQRYHGGITVSSSVGVGSCFSVSVPLSQELT